MRGKELLARRRELRELGFREATLVSSRDASMLARRAEELLPLSGVPGLTWRVEAQTQTVYITVPDERLMPTLLEPNEQQKLAGPVVIESGVGMTTNYDVTGTFSGGQRDVNGYLEVRSFSPRGVMSSSLLGHADESGSRSLVRLDSTYTFGDANTLQRYSLGDFITSGLRWTRPVRLTGAQLRSDFSMRPDLVTFPLPTVTGSVAVPSVVNVLADGNQVISRQIDAGPFEIPQLPVVSGAGTISMTVTNALGQQVTITQPFYASSALLRPGLHTFAWQAGLVRLNWGTRSNSYGKLAFVSTFRRGMTSSLTVEGNAEATPGLFMGGGGGVLRVKNLGVVNASVAASGGTGGSGVLLSAGAQRIGRTLSLGASATMAEGSFQDVAARNGEPVPRRQVNANVALSMKRAGSLGVFYAETNRADQTDAVSQVVTPAQRTRIASAGYSVPVGRFSFYANGFKELGSGDGPGVQAGLTILLGARRSVSVSGSSDGSGQGQVQAQQVASMVGDWGIRRLWRAGPVCTSSGRGSTSRAGGCGRRAWTAPAARRRCGWRRRARSRWWTTGSFRRTRSMTASPLWTRERWGGCMSSRRIGR